jgi:hypothetical protein
VEVTSLSARVNVTRQVSEQALVKEPPIEGWGQVSRIDAGEKRPHARVEHLARDEIGRATP